MGPPLQYKKVKNSDSLPHKPSQRTRSVFLILCDIILVDF